MLDRASTLAATDAPALVVGVTGHRLDRLDAAHLDALAQSIRDVLQAIAAATVEAGAVHPAPLRLVTGMADGADSIAAEAAHAMGWQVDAVLAFARDEFALDFEDGPKRAAHAARLDTAHAVFELAGQREAESGSGIAYERVGHTVLAQCDLLIAVWDNGPARGRGGAAQVVGEAVVRGIPVIQIDPSAAHAAVLLWDGLDEHDLGAQTVETVARGTLAPLPALVAGLIAEPGQADEEAIRRRFEAGRERRVHLAIAYPLLLALTGVRGLRRADIVAPRATAPLRIGQGVGAEQGDRLSHSYGRADREASRAAQLFRSGYVTNFSFAAIAVILSLAGLALPPTVKPVLIILELATIGTILIMTRAGNRAQWHRRWLDYRQLAERLRCLAISAQLGDLDLRGEDSDRWVDRYVARSSRMLGLPAARVDTRYLAGVKADLTYAVDAQIAYLSAEAHRMHRLEHRLHLTGTALFALTGVICVGFLLFEIILHATEAEALHAIAKPLGIAATIASAALPAIGAAIYGIRMQGDFAGTAERSATLAHHLSMLRKASESDPLDFDILRRRVRRATQLLTEDLQVWLATYHARPLTLPG